MPSQIFCASNSNAASSCTAGLNDRTCSSNRARSPLPAPPPPFPTFVTPYSTGAAAPSPPCPARLSGRVYPGPSSAMGAWRRFSTAPSRYGSSYQMVHPPWARALRLVQFLPRSAQFLWNHTLCSVRGLASREERTGGGEGENCDSHVRLLGQKVSLSVQMVEIKTFVSTASVGCHRVGV